LDSVLLKEKAMTQQQDSNSSRGSYDAIADKVGLVPNLRVKDNLYQGVAVAVLTLAGATVGFFLGPATERSLGIGLGALAGLVVGGLLSGLVLMVVGLLRKG
jgi:hypothetical protein